MTEVTGKTHLMFILADPVAHVRGSAFLNQHFNKMGMDAVTVPIHVTARGLPEIVTAISGMANLAGFGVTIPHKMEIIAHLDEITPTAKAIKAVNFVRKTPEGKLVGDNLDAAGFIGGLHGNGHSARAKRILQLGAGGAGRATAFALAEDGAGEIAIVNRSAARSELRSAFPGLRVTTSASPAEGFDIIVNTTSLGLKPSDPLLVDISRIEDSTIVYDIIANPPVTALLAAAEKRGAFTICAAAMLSAQMALVTSFVFPADER